MAKKEIRVANRELRRVVNNAVGGNFFKTVAEPLTNSDSALKKLASIPHAAGLVEEMLSLKKGDHLNTAELKKKIKPTTLRKITLEITTKGRRECCFIDDGPGMSEPELEKYFSIYAEAKAKGQRTRSLFGRGALDILLYHLKSQIFSVANGVLSTASIYWDAHSAVYDGMELGKATPALLQKYNLPNSIIEHGTVVRFQVKDGTRIPQEQDIVARISSFYMLRLIAADPNTALTIKRNRAGGVVENRASYDFPIGVVLGRFTDILDIGTDGKYKVDILVVRSDEPLEYDPMAIDHREGGLLFVDDNDAVMDVTLLPEYEKSPYLKQIFGLVRIENIRDVLEAKLDAEEAVAVLTETRDGFNRKNEITQELFKLVAKHVRPVYESEEDRLKKGQQSRSKELDKRIHDALKSLNQFNNLETEDPGGGPDPLQKPFPIYFGVESVQLHTGITRRVQLYVNQEQVKNGQLILIASDNSLVSIAPDECSAKHKKGETRHSLQVSITCDTKDQQATVTALTEDKDGKEYKAELKVLGVSDPPVILPPEDIDFANKTFGGAPNRSCTSTLIVNLSAFVGMPTITFYLKNVIGRVGLGDEKTDTCSVKVAAEHLTKDPQIARVPIQFSGTGWGQHAELWAKVKRKDGETAYANCKLRLEQPPGNDRFVDFDYEPLDTNVLAMVAGYKIYVNSAYRVHRAIFGKTREEFNSRLEENAVAQVRAAQLMVEAAVYDVANRKYLKGNVHIDADDPITSIRGYIEAQRMKLEPSVIKVLAPRMEDGAGSVG